MQLTCNLLQVLLLTAAPRLAKRVASPVAGTTSSPENTPIYVDLGSLLAPESAPFMKASLSAQADWDPSPEPNSSPAVFDEA
ncbi:hypothetical protein C8R44DRAFT_895133 [Mycena epipterygia]|nr:hypothetical protein C8R44DRAFT_895133 [Mycena epipterygia]